MTKFLKPSRRKVILALILPAIWLAVKTYSLSHPLQPEDNQTMVATLKTGVTYSFQIKALSYLMEAALYYPLSCALITIFGYYRRGELSELVRDRPLLGKVFVGVVLFNPIAVHIVIPLLYLGVMSLSSPGQPGLVVVKIHPESPANGFKGFEEGTAIYEIQVNNDEPERVTTVEEAQKVLDSAEPGVSLSLYYEGHVNYPWLKPGASRFREGACPATTR